LNVQNQQGLSIVWRLGLMVAHWKLLYAGPG